MSQISYLVLDYSKPLESRNALESIRRHAKHDHQIIFLSNGGDQSYVWKLYEDGLIDRLIVNKVNVGLGYGTETLFAVSDTDFSLYFQNDQELIVDLTNDNINYLIETIKNNPSIGAIGLAGIPCGINKYSERAHLIKTSFYNSIPKTHGGCGPFNHLKYNEQAVQEYFDANGLLFMTLATPIVKDCGKYTIRELPDGSIVKMRTDTKAVKWLKSPTKPYMFPEMNEKEWELSISGKWADWTIPESYRAGSFNCWGDIED